MYVKLISSIVGNIANFYCVILAISYAISFSVTSNGELSEGFVWNDWNTGLLIVTNVGAKAFVAHYPIAPMYEQLRNRSVKRMKFVMICGWIIVTTIYVSFGIAGYYLFGINTEGDVLNSYSRSNIAFTIARLAMAISVIGSYPIIFKSLLQTLEDKFFNYQRGSRYNFVEHPRVRTSVIIICSFGLMILGILIQNVGPVSSIEGAITVLGLVSLFPILIAWKVGNKPIQQRNNDIPNYTMGDIQSVDINNIYDYKDDKNRRGYIIYLGILLFIGISLGVGGIIMQLQMLS